MRTLHLVDVLAAGGLEEALEHGARDGIAGQGGGFAAVGDDEAVVALGRQLRQQPAELFAQVQVRFDTA